VHTAFIIHEFNCYENRPSLLDRARLATGVASSVPCRNRSSVWLAFPPYDHRQDDYTQKGTRIIGPVSTEQAEAVIRQLEAAFTSAGFQVTTDVAADD
jgi:hypothetical protein